MQHPLRGRGPELLKNLAAPQAVFGILDAHIIIKEVEEAVLRLDALRLTAAATHSVTELVICVAMRRRPTGSFTR